MHHLSNKYKVGKNIKLIWSYLVSVVAQTLNKIHLPSNFVSDNAKIKNPPPLTLRDFKEFFQYYLYQTHINFTTNVT